MAPDPKSEPSEAGHAHSHEHREAGRRSLSIALVFVAGFMVVEIIGGIASGSLALLADAGHMAADAMALILALLAFWIGDRTPDAGRTYGFRRVEVLAALLNVLSLWVIVGWIFFEAYKRFQNIDAIEIEGEWMSAVVMVGLLANVMAVWVLHRHAGHSLNIEGAFRHVVSDLLGSIGVLISAIIIITTGWVMIDPLLSVGIGLLVLGSSWGLIKKILVILLEGAPPHIDVVRLRNQVEALHGVRLVHDVHVWTIASGYDSLTAHVLVDDDLTPEEANGLLPAIRKIAGEDHNVQHLTVQIEQTIDGCTEDHLVSYLRARSDWVPTSDDRRIRDE